MQNGYRDDLSIEKIQWRLLFQRYYQLQKMTIDKKIIITITHTQP